MTDEKRFDIEFEGTGRATGAMRNDIGVRFVTMGESFELATDEGAFHGGQGTAPPPLALFTAALIGCVMTQIRAFAKRLDVAVGQVEVSARLHWQGVQSGRAPYVSAPVGFALDIDLDSDAPEEAQVRLVEAAKAGCFIEQSLAPGVITGHRLRLGNGWRDV